MINTITLAMKYHNQPAEYSKALDMLNMIFTAVFALEFIFKLAAFRFKVRVLSISLLSISNTVTLLLLLSIFYLTLNLSSLC